MPKTNIYFFESQSMEWNWRRHWLSSRHLSTAFTFHLPPPPSSSSPSLPPPSLFNSSSLRLFVLFSFKSVSFDSLLSSTFPMNPQKCQQLWGAATEGNLPLVQKLCQDPSINMNWQDDQELRSPFYRACGHGRTEVVRFLLGLKGIAVNLPQQDGDSPFFIACTGGHVDVVLLLLADQRVDPTKAGNDECTPFFMACQFGHVDVVSLLLADLRVDVNKPWENGQTPFYVACQNGHVDVVSALLGDKRVDINEPKEDGSTPLWIASDQGQILVVQHLLASEREIDTKKISAFDNTTATARARSQGSRTVKFDWESEEEFQRKKANGPKIVALIASFDRNPGQVRVKLRRELFEPLAGELFALVVFFSDGYFEIPGSHNHSQTEKSMKAQKFFSLALRLPMDLQMVLCNRVFGLEASIIKGIHSEEGFRKFANQKL